MTLKIWKKLSPCFIFDPAPEHIAFWPVSRIMLKYSFTSTIVVK